MARRKSTTKVQRANGMGTAYQLSGNRRKPWAARITLPPRLVDGKIITERPIIGYYETKEQADIALRQYGLDPTIKKETITMEQIYSEWITIHEKKTTESSMKTYRTAWNHLSQLSSHKFIDLRTGNFQMVIDSMIKEGLGKSSLKRVLVLSGLLYRYAMQNDIVDKNYSQFVVLPKFIKTKVETFTDLEIKLIEKNAGTVPFVDDVLLLIYTGLRIQEFIDLTPFNVHLEDGYIIAGGKTEAGTDRIIPIHPKIKALLKSRIESRKSHIITSKKGKPLKGTNYYRDKCYYPALESIGVTKRKPHVCRHTFATLLSDHGADINSIKEILGHKRYSTTADIYTHKKIDELKKAVLML